MAFMEVYDHKTPSIYHMKNSELAVSKTKTVKHIKDGFSHEKYNYNGLFVFDVCSLRGKKNGKTKSIL